MTATRARSTSPARCWRRSRRNCAPTSSSAAEALAKLEAEGRTARPDHQGQGHRPVVLVRARAAVQGLRRRFQRGMAARARAWRDPRRREFAALHPALRHRRRGTDLLVSLVKRALLEGPRVQQPAAAPPGSSRRYQYSPQNSKLWALISLLLCVFFVLGLLAGTHNLISLINNILTGISLVGGVISAKRRRISPDVPQCWQCSRSACRIATLLMRHSVGYATAFSIFASAFTHCCLRCFDAYSDHLISGRREFLRPVDSSPIHSGGGATTTRRRSPARPPLQSTITSDPVSSMHRRRYRWPRRHFRAPHRSPESTPRPATPPLPCSDGSSSSRQRIAQVADLRIERIVGGTEAVALGWNVAARFAGNAGKPGRNRASCRIPQHVVVDRLAVEGRVFGDPVARLDRETGRVAIRLRVAGGIDRLRAPFPGSPGRTCATAASRPGAASRSRARPRRTPSSRGGAPSPAGPGCAASCACAPPASASSNANAANLMRPASARAVPRPRARCRSGRVRRGTTCASAQPGRG